jgi:cellobiose-specific phosphotransferase system component IIC
MVCDLNRSITVGMLTTVVMAVILILWIGYDNVRNSTVTASQILLLVAILFVISTSMDYFNQCYTVCDNVASSLTYGLFTVAIIYAFYSLFIHRINFNTGNIGLFLLNVLIISLLHNVTCKMAHRELS